jgi:hypothetical protein
LQKIVDPTSASHLRQAGNGQESWISRARAASSDTDDFYFQFNFMWLPKPRSASLDFRARKPVAKVSGAFWALRALFSPENPPEKARAIIS